jgi:hypothetical protein
VVSWPHFCFFRKKNGYLCQDAAPASRVSSFVYEIALFRKIFLQRRKNNLKNMKKNNGYVLKTSRPGCVVHGNTSSTAVSGESGTAGSGGWLTSFWTSNPAHFLGQLNLVKFPLKRLASLTH